MSEFAGGGLARPCRTSNHGRASFARSTVPPSDLFALSAVGGVRQALTDILQFLFVVELLVGQLILDRDHESFELHQSQLPGRRKRPVGRRFDKRVGL